MMLLLHCNFVCCKYHSCCKGIANPTAAAKALRTIASVATACTTPVCAPSNLRVASVHIYTIADRRRVSNTHSQKKISASVTTSSMRTITEYAMPMTLVHTLRYLLTPRTDTVLYLSAVCVVLDWKHTSMPLASIETCNAVPSCAHVGIKAGTKVKLSIHMFKCRYVHCRSWQPPCARDNCVLMSLMTNLTRGLAAAPLR
jgi:hypothetical protein